ncbi:MAG: GNAT family N-acetyltransferase [Candidatus Poribacteria bacterium]
MIPNIVIRDGGPADADFVAGIAVEAWRPIYEHARETLGPELFTYLHTDWEAEKARQVRRACEADTAGEVLVATLDGVIIAFVSFSQRAPEVGEIGNNAVRPDYQSRGIATRLYEAALDKLRAAGMLYVSVSTGGDPAHAPARRAYEKVGFGQALPSVTYHRRL